MANYCAFISRKNKNIKALAMSRFIGMHDLPPLLHAANHWKKACLLNNGSVFSERQLWTPKNLTLIEKLFVNNPDEGDNTFFEKLKEQLGTKHPDVLCLAAEMLWLLSLPSLNVSQKTKVNNVITVWEWSGRSLHPDHALLSEKALAGYARTGVSYNTNRWREMAYLIDITKGIIALPEPQRKRLLSDGWRLAQWLEERAQSRRQLRHILLFLLFPDDFERIASGVHRLKIVSAFDNVAVSALRKMQLIEVDKKLMAIRQRMEKSLGTKDIDFYLSPLVEVWRNRDKEADVDLASRIAQDEEEREQEIADDDELEKTIRVQLIKARFGHGIYRRKLAEVEKACRVTHVSDKRFLTASHIKPWRDCETQNECLDGNNGLWLAPHIDRLFDHGWITFDPKGELVCFDACTQEILKTWNIELSVNIGKLNKSQQRYMQFHRDYVYQMGRFYKNKVNEVEDIQSSVKC